MPFVITIRSVWRDGPLRARPGPYPRTAQVRPEVRENMYPNPGSRLPRYRANSDTDFAGIPHGSATARARGSRVCSPVSACCAWQHLFGYGVDLVRAAENTAGLTAIQDGCAFMAEAGISSLKLPASHALLDGDGPKAWQVSDTVPEPIGIPSKIGVGRCLPRIPDPGMLRMRAIHPLTNACRILSSAFDSVSAVCPARAVSCCLLRQTGVTWKLVPNYRAP